MTKQVKKFVDTIMVELIDMARWNADANAHINNGKKYEFALRPAAMVTNRDGFIMLIDRECVGRMEKHNDDSPEFIGGTRVIDELDIYEDLSAEEAIAVFPSYRVAYSVEELKTFKSGEKMTLREFMGERYEYNTRIRSNTSELIEWWRGAEKRDPEEAVFGSMQGGVE
jgi:hypothetical protein